MNYQHAKELKQELSNCSGTKDIEIISYSDSYRQWTRSESSERWDYDKTNFEVRFIAISDVVNQEALDVLGGFKEDLDLYIRQDADYCCTATNLH